MVTAEALKLRPEHQQIWQRFMQNHLLNNRLAHAILLLGSLSSSLDKLSQYLVAALLCTEALSKPCLHCKSCQLMTINGHPDYYLIKPEKAGAAIKIEQIRTLQTYVFNSSTLSKNKVICIANAEKMNSFTANSLLKILEEPPENTYFILIAESIATIPATLLSRCQRWHVPELTPQPDNYLAQANYYDKDSARGKMFAQCENLINDLIALKSNSVSVNKIAEKWSVFELEELIRLLYLISAQMIHYSCYPNYPPPSKLANLYDLAKQFKLPHLFNLLNRLNLISKQIKYNVNLNTLLTLEDLFLGYLQ